MTAEPRPDRIARRWTHRHVLAHLRPALRRAGHAGHSRHARLARHSLLTGHAGHACHALLAAHAAHALHVRRHHHVTAEPRPDRIARRWTHRHVLAQLRTALRRGAGIRSCGWRRRRRLRLRCGLRRSRRPHRLRRRRLRLRLRLLLRGGGLRRRRSHSSLRCRHFTRLRRRRQLQLPVALRHLEQLRFELADDDVAQFAHGAARLMLDHRRADIGRIERHATTILAVGAGVGDLPALDLTTVVVLVAGHGGLHRAAVEQHLAQRHAPLLVPPHAHLARRAAGLHAPALELHAEDLILALALAFDLWRRRARLAGAPIRRPRAVFRLELHVAAVERRQHPHQPLRRQRDLNDRPAVILELEP